MAEYIEREKLIKKLNEAPAYFDSGDIRYGIDIATQQVIEQPTADVVEVVRCKDCKHAKLDLMEKGLAVCRRPVLKNGQLLPLNLETKYNDYCSYGELKECEDNC